MKGTPVSYSLGSFELDAVQRLLLRRGKPVPLAPKAVETLLFLVKNSGRLVDKEELMKRVWPDTFVEEGNLTTNIHLLRKVLGKGSKGQEYIETIPRRGYRFTAEVKENPTGVEGLPVKPDPTREAVVQERREPSATTEVQAEVGEPLGAPATDMKRPKADPRAGVPAEIAGTGAAGRDQGQRLAAKAGLGARPLTQAVAAGILLAGLVVVWTHLRPECGLESPVRDGSRLTSTLAINCGV